MEAMWAVSALIVLLALKVDPQALRFRLKPYLKFLGIITLLTAARLAMLHSLPDGWQYERESFKPILNEIEPFTLLMVWWEDAFFVLPLLLMVRKRAWKYGIFILGAVLSSMFAVGHLYQGEFFALISLFYVPAMLYYAKKHGIGTTSACHVTYDLATFALIYYWINVMP